MQLGVEVVEWLAHTTETSHSSANSDINRSAYNPSPPERAQDHGTTLAQLNGYAEESQAHKILSDDSNDTNHAGFAEPSEESTAVPDTTEKTSSFSDSSTGIVDNALSSLFSHIFQRTSDEVTFTYCQ
ncbi:hypothetical protein IL306_010528 [Fusarium sp. DS 682]|nr:hypothetical protein IL306_010528 [Fusarium sp. DS 682]